MGITSLTCDSGVCLINFDKHENKGIICQKLHNSKAKHVFTCAGIGGMCSELNVMWWCMHDGEH